MNFILYYEWTIFVLIELASFFTLSLFGVTRYYFGKRRLSLIFIFTFLVLTIAEAGLGLLVYQATGKFTVYQFILIVFVLYACTIGIYDFIKLDRWLRDKVSDWRGVDLLSEDERHWIRMKAQQNEKRFYLYKSLLHISLFLFVQLVWGWNSLSFIWLSILVIDSVYSWTYLFN